MLPNAFVGILKYDSIKLNKTLALMEFIFWSGKLKIHKVSKHILSHYDNFYE